MPTEPCACAQEAIKRGYLILDPDCKANQCKELRERQPLKSADPCDTPENI